VVNTNIVGTYNGSVVALRHFLAQKSGKLINLLGRGDAGAVPMQNAYSSSKAWVCNFTQALAQEYKGRGVDIFGFNPGLVRTEMLSHVEAVSGYEGRLNPLRYVAMVWGNEADVPAAHALWLASPATDGRNGLMSTVLTKRLMLSRLVMLPFQKLFNRSVKPLDLTVTSVESAYSGD
jgi:NAD(P)-dependent dehydrogenase (short-subunit alcohol dehydrogenase family)